MGWNDSDFDRCGGADLQRRKIQDYTPFVCGLIFPLMAVLSFGKIQVVLLAVGIPLYLLLRPKGVIKTCPHCRGKYLDYLAFCPHCKRKSRKSV